MIERVFGMKLLVPVDGSAASMNAVKKAAEIAKKDGYSVKMISVIKPDDLQEYKRYSKIWQRADGSLFDKHILPVSDEEAVSRMKRMTAALMESVAAEVDFGTIWPEKEVLIGEPYEVILQTAKDEKFDLIVIGNRGFSKIKRFFLGSVAQRVIAEAPCPVLVIHTDAKE